MEIIISKKVNLEKLLKRLEESKTNPYVIIQLDEEHFKRVRKEVLNNRLEKSNKDNSGLD